MLSIYLQTISSFGYSSTLFESAQLHINVTVLEGIDTTLQRRSDLCGLFEFAKGALKLSVFSPAGGQWFCRIITVCSINTCCKDREYEK